MRKSRTAQKVPFLAPDVATKVIPSPTDGWDAISPLAEMDPKRAPILDNWVPRPGYVELRGGYLPFANVGSSTPVQTLMVRRGPTGEKMFAAAGSAIYDVSTGIASSVVTGLSSARWQYVNFTPAGGTTVIQLVNGSDTLRQYDGTTWTVPAITGIAGGTSSIVNINAQKRRLWYIINQSTVAYFMPTDAITGAVAGSLDLGALWTKGGYLVAMTSWTIDGGSGPSDYALFISSRGQVSLYAGTDPTNAGAWSLVGTFDIAPPIGRRCVIRIGSDVGIITQQGVIPISQALPFDPSADRSVAITARIQNAMAAAAANAQNNFGWQMLTYPNQQLAILNVPITENSLAYQYVMSALTGGWSRFTGWNSNCFEIFNDKLYWGGNTGDVNQGYAGGSDATNPIAADMQCAFNWLDEPGRAKRMTMVQPLLTIGGDVSPMIAVDTDFTSSVGSASISSVGGSTLWNVALWDVALWPSASSNFLNWLTVNPLGHAMAIRMKVNLNANLNLPLGVFDAGVFNTAEFDVGFSTTQSVLQINAFNSIVEMGGAI